MKMRGLLGVVALLLLGAASAVPGPRYEVVHGWPILPDGEMLGQATGVYNTFYTQPHLISRNTLRTFRSEALRVWDDVTAA